MILCQIEKLNSGTKSTCFVIMEAPVIKRRTPSRCREWERNRRNKFNDAISRLGEIVKEIYRSNSGTKEAENVQYPKVEIVEKAIICLTTFVHENAQLKAEMLALQVKIDTERKQKENKIDVSTQVLIRGSKKTKSNKHVKVVTLRKALGEKSVLTSNIPVNSNVDNNKTRAKDIKLKGPLPVLLPKANFSNKKCSENTIVVLPATPYIFPQRPLLFPTVPPAFLLVDQNLQTLNKPSFPITNRGNSDITKTTMVNILPISAYSRPLSAIKPKKKPKSGISKKVKKSNQINSKVQSDSVSSSKTKLCIEVEAATSHNEYNNEMNKQSQSQESKPSENSNAKISNDTKDVTAPQIDVNKNEIDDVISKSTNDTTTTLSEKSKTMNIIEDKKDPISPKSIDHTSNFEKSTMKKTENIVDKTKSDKVPSVKDPLHKNKDTKLPNILETTLCESAVDGGNARLELAEEFLAASPTAAFLMSFPLVSGNRADSPAEETTNTVHISTKENTLRRNDMTSHSLPCYGKVNSSEVKAKAVDKCIIPNSTVNKQNEYNKYVTNSLISKDTIKTSSTTVTTTASNENPFLNLSMSSLLPTTCTLSDTNFGIDFDCNISKSVPSQCSSYVSNNNLFYKSDPFSTVKSTIYSTSSISSGHDFNSFGGLYPCAMEKYTSKNKSDYSNVEDNLMKIGSSRLTYDIDLGWSHKGFDFVSCTTASNTFNKDNILTTASGSYSSSYNPFNPDFHVPLVSTSNKKENYSSKPTTSYPDTITSFYSQPSNLWSEETPFYTNNNASKSLTSRHQNYFPVEHAQINVKQNSTKQYESKLITGMGVENSIKPTHSGTTPQVQQEKYKKSPSKMHINWMTSEVRPMQTHCNPNPTHTELKEPHKPIYSQPNQTKKQDLSENNYFPISMHNFPSQSIPEELQVWPSVRPAGTTEISIEPPPINLPTLVGDLALGPHDKKKTSGVANRGTTQPDIQNCSNFFSVTQLMNRSTDTSLPTRYQGATNVNTIQNQKAKQNMSLTINDHNRKPMSNTENHIPQPCYMFNDPKTINAYDNMNQFSHNKVKANKPDKNSKAQKNSYSAEALIRGGTCNQKVQDNNSAKFMMSSQKYNDFNTAHDSSVAQVSHFPPILDYSENCYTGQQFSGTNLYNTTTNTISNSFYSNFMSGSSNLMPGNYTSGPFTGDFIDYNQTPECSYPNHKYTELKMKNQPTMFQQEKGPSNYKSSRRESAVKHKLECSKKDSNKKCQSKRTKLNNDVEEWSDTAHLPWQHKSVTKRHVNFMPEELPFPNYVSNQVAAAAGQYQPDFLNSHIMSSNMQPVVHNVDRSLTLPVTSRANFNLSTIFPEITMKVQ